MKQNKLDWINPLRCPGNPSVSAVANIKDRDNMTENIKTKAKRKTIILKGQINPVGLNPNGIKLA